MDSGQYIAIQEKYIGDNDELFDPEKVIGYGKLPKEAVRARSVSEIVKNENHLSILNVADKLIGDTIKIND